MENWFSISAKFIEKNAIVFGGIASLLVILCWIWKHAKSSISFSWIYMKTNKKLKLEAKEKNKRIETLESDIQKFREKIQTQEKMLEKIMPAKKWYDKYVCKKCKNSVYTQDTNIGINMFDTTFYCQKCGEKSTEGLKI